jgi:L-lactate dehydrogenase complex protein LldG
MTERDEPTRADPGRTPDAEEDRREGRPKDLFAADRTAGDRPPREAADEGAGEGAGEGDRPTGERRAAEGDDTEPVARPAPPSAPQEDRFAAPEVDLASPTGRVIPEPVRSTGPITRGAIADAARMVVLGRIKAALADVPTAERPHHVRVTRAYRTSDDSPRADLVERLVDRLTDYGAAVHRVAAERLPRVILDACRARGVKRLVVPADLPEEWRPGYAEVLVDDAGSPLDLASIDATDGVVTACALAIAETGTIVLDGGDWQGRRAITLVPDYHLCVVHADQVVGTVPEAVAALAAAADRPLTLISGPSATSDIELNRVEGVHGPRTLEVMLIG